MISIKMEKPEKKGLGSFFGFGKKKDVEQKPAANVKPATLNIAANAKPLPDETAGQAKTEAAVPVKTAELSKPAEPAKPAEPSPKPVEPAAVAAIGAISLAKTADPAPAKPLPSKEDKGATETFFSRTKEEEKDTTMMKSILTKSAPPKIKPILGSAPTLQKSIEAEKEISQKKMLRTSQIVALVSVLAAGGMAFYFYSQLAPGFDLFGQNPTAQLTEINKNLRSSQTVINKYRYLAAQLDLNSFSYVSDDFMDKTNQMTMKELSALELDNVSKSVAEAAEELPARLAAIKDNLTPAIVIETYRTEAEEEKTAEQIEKDAETDLRNALLEDRKKLTQESGESETNDQDLRLIDNTLKLVGNKQLINSVKNSDPEKFKTDLLAYADSLDVLQREALQKMMGNILATTKSDISTIGAIKAQRIAWLWIIDKIEEVTITVDPNFNSGLFEVTGLEVTFDGYTMDATSNQVVISGKTRTIDAKNFTLITELIDAFEASPYFEGAGMRSFSKSGDEIKGFEASFQLNLTIEKEGITSVNKSLSQTNRPVAMNATGVKRSK